MKAFGGLLIIFAVAGGGYLMIRLFESPQEFQSNAPTYLFIGVIAFIALVFGFGLLKG